MIICLIVYALLTIVAGVMQIVSYRIKNDVTGKALAVCAVAAIVVLIGYLSLDNSSSVTGGYVYYINGAPISGGVMRIGVAFIVAFMSLALSYWISVGLGWLFGKQHIRNPQQEKKPKLLELLIWICLALYSISLFTLEMGSSSTVFIPRNILVIVGILGLTRSVWGIVGYIKKVKSQKNE